VRLATETQSDISTQRSHCFRIGAKRMQHLWGKAVDGFGLCIGSLLDQAVYHPCDAFLVCKVKRRHTFAISSGHIRPSFQEESENAQRVALCSKV
jgi:hypothetical protein